MYNSLILLRIRINFIEENEVDEIIINDECIEFVCHVFLDKKLSDEVIDLTTRSRFLSSLVLS